MFEGVANLLAKGGKMTPLHSEAFCLNLYMVFVLSLDMRKCPAWVFCETAPKKASSKRLEVLLRVPFLGGSPFTLLRRHISMGFCRQTNKKRYTSAWEKR